MPKVCPGLWWCMKKSFKININMYGGGCDVEVPPRKLWFNSLEELNLFSLIATKLACKNDGGGT